MCVCVRVWQGGGRSVMDKGEKRNKHRPSKNVCKAEGCQSYHVAFSGNHLEVMDTDCMKGLLSVQRFPVR